MFRTSKKDFLCPKEVKMDVKLEKTTISDRKLLEYSMQLAMLTTLLQKQLISQNEYDKVKRKLMKEYHIISSIMN